MTCTRSDETLDLCGYRGQGKVFKGFTKTTTQIYADLVNAKKRETVNNITLK